ncbi:outer membrane beta-barrel protein [Mucilaginibacter pedocola]|uniref:Outer membrane protein beta-barrel domain-containing protein n=1 Tax=Mucilaginibacter pedocola TaxID=1792845 RepID=A0A1S9P7G9_9SPHI|nr:outer membrane beta-barrel protein [Mucilaginibacter pedocola]OOQ56886.1 hypothetical protein BC343_18080 [Mucilaginibacter pedocola]
MKKLLLSLAFATLSFCAFAQVPTAGLKGGLNFAQISGSDGSGGTSTSGTLTSFSVGAFLEFAGDGVAIQPGLFYTGKGSKSKTNSGISSSLNLRYLQLPVNFVINVPAGFGKLYIGAGPYAAYGLSGKVESSNNGGTPSTTNLSFGQYSGQLKRMDYGAQGIAGLRFNTGFLIGVNYDLGLANIVNNASVKSKNRVLGVSVGVTF